MSEADTQDDPVTAHAGVRGVITVALMAATTMQGLDSTIANIALPRVQGELSASQDQMGWVLTSYIVATAIFIPLTGWLANAYGRRIVLQASVILFTTVSLLCGLATSLPQLVVFRLLQGIGGAALVPISQSILLSINEPKDYGKAMALWAGSAQLGTIFGPILGGLLTEHLNWRWIFFINLPIGALALLGLLPLKKEHIDERPPFDVMGFAVLSIAVGSLQLMLDRGQQLDWFSSREILIEALVAGLGLYVFIIHMFTSDRPYLNPRLFVDPNFLASNLFIFVVGVVLFATLALLPPLLQNEMNYPIVLAGLVVAPRGLGTLIAMAFLPRLLAVADGRVVITAGLLLVAYALWGMSHFSPEMSYAPVAVNGLIQGFGIAMVYLPLAAFAFSTLDPALRNEGAAFYSLMRNLGSSIGISIVLFMLTRNSQTMHESLAAITRVPSADPASAAISARVDPFGLNTLAGINDYITHQGTFVAYLNDFRFMMIATLATLPFVFFLRKGRLSETLPSVE